MRSRDVRGAEADLDALHHRTNSRYHCNILPYAVKCYPTVYDGFYIIKSTLLQSW